MRQKLKKIWFYGTWFLKFTFLMVIFLIFSIPLRFSKKYKNLWLISERPDEARDNGYWFYKWILENKPETNIRYVLSKKSTDYEKMPRKDLIIQPGSMKHYVCYILSKYSISTHMHGACPGKSFVIPFLPFCRKKKTVFLQHGITQNRINIRGSIDIITAASEQEKQLIESSNPRYKNKVYVTGFCRYDQLEDTSKDNKEKIILVMPTFRKWLRDIGRLKNADKVFVKTNYYKKWNSFLNNNEIKKVLEKNNAKIIFFPHKEMQELAHNFIRNGENVTIGKPGEYDIQNLLKKSNILITDYSSVFFDFVYMNKPVIFYQFDQKDFFNKHYKSSDKKYPFGDTITDEEKVVDKLEKIIDNNCRIDENYKKDVKNFFKFRNKHNCERVYKTITEIKNEK